MRGGGLLCDCLALLAVWSSMLIEHRVARAFECSEKTAPHEEVEIEQLDRSAYLHGGVWWSSDRLPKACECVFV